MKNNLIYDIDPIETKEWLQSIESVIKEEGIERAKFIINKVLKKIHKEKKDNDNNNYINTIPFEEEPDYPGNIEIEKKICSTVRWNAAMMVLNASKKKIDLGGHIASFQSIADIYEVCFNHFFKASNNNDGGDIIYFQGHTSPGIYSRAFLEGRLTEKQLNNFRQEVYGNGLSSYPHPKLMPEFWQFPTVSMGLGPINAIYQAKFLKYLHNRNLKNTKNQTVYAFIGDGEMDEPESKGSINIASREKLDNLIFIINCNLQRLDGPVIGNGKIINELENIFKGSGWEVIKVIWGNLWDNLFKKDNSKKLIKLVNETLDGDYQTLRSKNGSYIRKNFFGKYNETKKLVKNMSDDQIFDLNHGGHDYNKIYAAIKKAKSIISKPVVILFHTIKGYSMGSNGESMNIAHQIKNMSIDNIRYFKNRLKLNNINEKDIESLKYINFKKDSEEYNYLHKRRKFLNGYVPKRLKNFTKNINLPSLKEFSNLFNEQKKHISTTIAFVRILNILLKNKFIKDKIVPIIADEARTFGMEGLFRQIGIYNSKGQNYTPQDINQISYYREDNKGQILQEGINELGAASSWLAAATSYSTNNLPIIPFYIYYSMFGFQRIGDLFWASGDQQARGFLIGATSGRTTLNGEGLQHGDGHSHVQSLTIPNCISYDPSYAYEIAVIIHNGLIRMYGDNSENIYYYITTTNENYLMPSMPNNIENGIIKGIYKLISFKGTKCKVQIMGSGSILREVIKAANILSEDFNIKTYVYSVTSFTELARDGQDCDRWNILHPNKKPKKPYLTNILNNSPIVAATDYMKIYAEQIRKFIPSKEFHVLGTDGFGLSDSRKNLRDHFEIDKKYIVIAALNVLYKNGNIDSDIIFKTIKKYGINSEKNNPRF
ncbi:MAG: pyruvate dehydrogenase (acetyl-transferring), homodimeric type [Enterobacterales bacterium]